MRTFAIAALAGAVLAHPGHDELREEHSIGQIFDKLHEKA